LAPGQTEAAIGAAGSSDRERTLVLSSSGRLLPPEAVIGFDGLVTRKLMFPLSSGGRPLPPIPDIGCAGLSALKPTLVPSSS